MEASVLCWLATVDEYGAPNVSPKEIFASYGDDTLLVANIASPNTIRNLRFHSKVCLSFVDAFVQKSFKLSGTARVAGPKNYDFSILLALLEAMTQGKLSIHSVIAVRVERVAPIVALGCRQFPGASEASQIEDIQKHEKR